VKLNLESELSETSITVYPKLWSNTTKKFVSCSMLFDTGAFMTVIDKAVADRLGYERLKPDGIYDRDTISGINGKIPCEYTIIPNILIDRVEFGSICACVVEFAGIHESNAILGFNFLREFKSVLDIMRLESSVNITLEPKFDITDIHKGDRFNKLESRFGLAYAQGEYSPKNEDKIQKMNQFS